MAENPDFEFPGRNIKWGQNIGGTDASGTLPNNIVVTGLSITGVQGDILYNNGTTWVTLAPSTSGYFLTTQGAGANPIWSAQAADFIQSVDSNFTVSSNQLQLHTIAAGNIIANSTSSTAEPTSTTLTATIDQAIGATQGQILYRGASSWSVLSAGTSGQVLKTQGTSANPAWSSTSQTWEGAPGGRLTLTSATPIQTADVSGGTTIYYYPYIHNKTPWFIGIDIGTSISLALDSNSGHTGYQQSGKNFDLFLYSDSGTLRLLTGPAWSSDTSRGTGAGTTELDFTTYLGLPTNKNSMTGRFGSSSGNTVTCAVNTALCVGTMRATANGQCTAQFNPALAAGGSNTIMGLSNVFHPQPAECSSGDSTASWTYATFTWRASNNSTSNRISFVNWNDVSLISATFIVGVAPGDSNVGYAGINLNSTSTTPKYASQVQPVGALLNNVCVVKDQFNAGGFNYIQAVERALIGGVGSVTFIGGAFQRLSIDLKY